MPYTFLNQQDFLSTLLGDLNTDSASMWPLAQRKTELNHAEKQFARDTKIILENATGTVSSMEISVPSGWLETFALYITVGSVKYRIDNDREISPKDLERWTDYGGDIPYFYFWSYSGTRKIKLLGSASGINGAAYDLYYFMVPTTDLSLDADVSSLPEEYRQASVYKAASNLLMQIGQNARAGQFLQMYDRLVQQAKQEVGRWYQDYDQPRPDFNIVYPEQTDRQGVGWGGWND